MPDKASSRFSRIIAAANSGPPARKRCIVDARRLSFGATNVLHHWPMWVLVRVTGSCGSLKALESRLLQTESFCNYPYPERRFRTLVPGRYSRSSLGPQKGIKSTASQPLPCKNKCFFFYEFVKIRALTMWWDDRCIICHQANLFLKLQSANHAMVCPSISFSDNNDTKQIYHRYDYMTKVRVCT